MTLGINISNYRKQRRLTQEQLTELSGLTVNYVSKLERGLVHKASATTVQHLAKVLGVTMEDLMADSNSQTTPTKPYQDLLNKKINEYGESSEEVSKLLLKILNIN